MLLYPSFRFLFFSASSCFCGYSIILLPEQNTEQSPNKKQNSKMSPVQFLFRIIQGALIGLGAVLPGISGGVLCVVFGIYKPS